MNQTPDTLDQVLERIRATFEVEFEPLNIDAQTLYVLNINNMQSHIENLLRSRSIHEPLRDLPLWARVWPSSFVLGRFLRKYDPPGKTMLEIGAGMGVCGMVAARYGFSHITMTDMEESALDFARANVLRNGLGDMISVRNLDITAPWRNDDSIFDIIAASEVLYLDDLHRPLLKFVNRHLAPGGKAFFCTDLARAKPRFKKLAAKDFHVTEGNIGVTRSENAEDKKRRIYNILILERP